MAAVIPGYMDLLVFLFLLLIVVMIGIVYECFRRYRAIRAEEIDANWRDGYDVGFDDAVAQMKGEVQDAYKAGLRAGRH